MRLSSSEEFRAASCSFLVSDHSQLTASQLTTLDSQRLLVDSVLLVEPCAGELRRLVDVAIVLEHPRELGAFVRAAFQLLVQRDEQQRVDAERPSTFIWLGRWLAERA